MIMHKLNDIIVEVVRSIYGAANPNYSRQTRGGGACGGFRLGRGKPGYPVPQEMLESIPYLDEGEGIPKSPIMDDPSKDPNVPFSDLYEGGAAVGGERIERENIAPTLDVFKKQILSKIKHKSVKEIGSTGKKAVSGDIDVGFDTDLSLDEIGQKLSELGVEHKVNKGLGEVNCKFQQFGKDGKKLNKFVQIDLMVGPEAWTDFSYFSAGENETKYKGVYRAGAVLAILKSATEKKNKDGTVTYFSVSPSRGIFQKRGKYVTGKTGAQEFKAEKGQQEYISDPEKVVQLISKGTGVKWTLADIKTSFEKILEKAKASFDSKKFAEVKKYISDFITGIKMPMPSELNEEDKKPRKGIVHLEDMKPDQFLKFLEKYKDLTIKGGLEVSEKVDGSARITFGVENGKLWTASKNGPKKFSSSDYPDAPMWMPLKMAHKALESQKQQIIKAMPKDMVFVAEVLYTKIPNSIEYGPNVIMIHGIQSSGKVPNEEQSKKIATDFLNKVGNKLSDGKDEWLFEYKRIIQPKDVMVDVKKEYSSIKQIYDELKKLEPDKLKASGKASYKSTLQKFKAIQIALKKKLVGKLRKQKSAYGPEGGDIEGLVFRDLESGDLVKIVDKEYFTKLNNFLWSYRKMLGDGIKLGDEWKPGVMTQFRAFVGDEVMGSPAAKLQSFVQTLKRFGETLEYPAEVNTPEKKADYIIAKYIEKNKLMQGDFISKFEKVLAKVRKQFESIKSDWDSKKGKKIVFTAKDEEGNPIKKVAMDSLVKQRNEDAMAGMQEFLDGLDGALDEIRGLNGESTKRTALLKIFIGQRGLDKLKDIQTDELEGDVEENVIYEKFSSGVYQGDDFVEMAERYANLLHDKKGIVVGKPLGKGGNGVAFDIGNNQVLKITVDDEEASTSNYLKKVGKNTKHIVHIFDVFKFPKTFKTDQEYFGIVQEKLDSITDSGTLYNKLSNALINLSSLFGVNSIDEPWDKIAERIINRVKAAEKSGILDTEEKVQKVLETAENCIRTLEDFQIDEIINELAKLKIVFQDLHVGNVMKRGNDFVVIDLGVSQSPKGGRIPKLSENSNHDNIIYALNTHNFIDLLKKKKNIKLGTILGKGYYGIAYDIGDNKVLKITPDDSEAKTSNFIKGKNTKHIYKVFDVFKFPSFQPRETDDLFGIVVEKLEKLTTVEQNEFEEALNKIRTGRYDVDFSEESFEVAFEKCIEQVRNFVQPEQLATFEITDLKYAKEVLIKFQFPQITDELQRLKIVFRDFHSGNLMKRGSDYVVIDLGNDSKSSNAGKIPDLNEASESSPGSEYPDYSDGFVITPFLDLLKQKKGIEIGTKLGEGSYGVAYDIGNNRVLKVTGDETEAKTSNYIIGKTTKDGNIVNVFDVFKFPKVKNYVVHYGIVQEKLDKPTKLEQKRFDFAMNAISDYSPNIGEYMYQDDFEVIIQKNIEIAKEDLPRAALKKRLAVIELAKKLLIDFQFPQMLNQLRQLKIKFQDFHDGNFMKRGNKYVVIDLGVSKSPEGGAIKGLDEANLSGTNAFDSALKDDSNDDMFAAVLKSTRKALLKKNIDIDKLKELGEGSKGIAYDIGDGRVLKVTTDETEARASMHILNKNTEYVCRIFDVFRFKELDLFGIIQEKLEKLTGNEKKELEFAMEDQIMLVGRAWKYEERAIRYKIEDYAYEAEEKGHEVSPKAAELDKALIIAKKYNVPEMVDEVRSNGIIFKDYHSGNIMKRGNRYVLIDLGYSVSPATHVPTLESRIFETILKLVEVKAATIGLTIGRYQPFHKGHAAIIRKLAAKYSKVIVIIAGNTKDKKNPFSYELRKELMEKSLPDVLPKLEIYKATFEGKNSGYLPGIISDIIKNQSSSIEVDTAINIVVGADRFDSIKQQMEHSKTAGEKGINITFNPAAVVVKKMPEIKNDDEDERISGTKIREALLNDNRESVKSMLDSHLISNKTEFENLYKKMKDEISVETNQIKSKATVKPKTKLESITESIISEIGFTVPTAGFGSAHVGTRASSSPWSNASMYDNEWPWQDKLKQLPQPSSGSADVVCEDSLDNATHNKFEKLVADELNKFKINAIHKGESHLSDVQVFYNDEESYVEVKMDQANLVSARFKFANGEWIQASKSYPTEFALAIIEDLNKNGKNFLTELKKFVKQRRTDKKLPQNDNIEFPSPKGVDDEKMMSNKDLSKFVTLEEMKEFFETCSPVRTSKGKSTQYIFINNNATGMEKLVIGHYKKKKANYMQYGDNFYIIGKDILGLNKDIEKLDWEPIPSLEISNGRVGVRVGIRTARYELIPELKIKDKNESPYSIFAKQDGKLFPFVKAIKSYRK
jgi:cytidyltransferase-like protein